MLFGHTKSDGLLFTPPWARSDDDVRAHLRTLFPNITKSALDQVIDEYAAPSSSSARANVDRFATLLDDATIRCNSHYLAEASLASNTRIYHSVFKYEFNVPPATHGADLSYTVSILFLFPLLLLLLLLLSSSSSKTSFAETFRSAIKISHDQKHTFPTNARSFNSTHPTPRKMASTRSWRSSLKTPL